MSCTLELDGRSAWRTTRPESAAAPGVSGAGVDGEASDPGDRCERVASPLSDPSSRVIAPTPYPTAPINDSASSMTSHLGTTRPRRGGGAGGTDAVVCAV